MSEFYNVADNKKIRVIIDADAACEADDQFAIAHALMTQKFIVKGITSAHYGKAYDENSENKSYDEIVKVCHLMNRNDIPIIHGITEALDSDKIFKQAEAVDFIIKEALTKSDYPLYVFCQGAVTNVASALLKNPSIADKMTIIWIGGGAYPHGGGEFNLQNDFHAVNVLFASKAEVWQVPNNCYSRMRTSYAELQEKVRPYGEIGKYLFEQMQAYGNSDKANWTMGESWSLGDSPVVGLAMDFCIGDFEYLPAPMVNENGDYILFNENRKVRVYQNIDSRFILEDMFAKFKIFYG